MPVLGPASPKSETVLSEKGPEHLFSCKQLLHWFETLSLIGKTSVVTGPVSSRAIQSADIGIWLQSREPNVSRRTEYRLNILPREQSYSRAFR
jgi:hypothetical protein